MFNFLYLQFYCKLINLLFSTFLEHLRKSLSEHHRAELEERNLKFEEELDYVKDELKKIKELRSKEVNFYYLAMWGVGRFSGLCR